MARLGYDITNKVSPVNNTWWFDFRWSASYSGNTATIYWEIHCRAASGNAYISNYGFSASVNGTSCPWSNRFDADGLIASGTFTKSGGESFSVSIIAHPYSSGTTCSFSATYYLDSAIQTPTVSCSILSRGIDTISVSMSVSNNGGANIKDNYIELFSNSGCTSKIGTVSGTRATFSGLNPNTTYYARANASNGTYRGYSSVQNTKTYDIAKISTIPNQINHGDNLNLQITNPAGVRVTGKIKVNNKIIKEIELSSGSNSISFIDRELDNIYKQYKRLNSLTMSLESITANKENWKDTKNIIVILTGNQKTVKLKNKRAKAIIKNNNQIKKAVVWIGDSNNVARRCI